MGSAALPEGWEEYFTDDGEAYYFHEESNTTTWDRPVAEEASPVAQKRAEATNEVSGCTLRRRPVASHPGLV